MRGQYKLWVPIVQITTSEASIGGLIVPANTLIEINRIEVIGGAAAANQARFQLRRFTGNTPTLSNAVVAKAVDQGNAIAAGTTFGAKGAAGNGAVWSATPTTPDAEAVHAGRFEAFGGRDAWSSTLQEALRLGGAAASYYDLLGIAGANVDCALRIVFTE